MAQRRRSVTRHLRAAQRKHICENKHRAWHLCTLSLWHSTRKKQLAAARKQRSAISSYLSARSA